MTTGVLCITPRNREAATGLTWQWWKAHAAELGVRVITIGGKRMIRASEIDAALAQRAAAVPAPPPRELTDAEMDDALIERLGLVRVAPREAR